MSDNDVINNGWVLPFLEILFYESIVFASKGAALKIP